jgi:hypothetical protein
MDDRNHSGSSLKLLTAATALITVAQLSWFALDSHGDIDFDGMTYTAIASDLRAGRWFDSIAAFRSPLISWLTAIVPHLGVLAAGKLVTVASFLLTAILLFYFTMELWGSYGGAISAVLLLVLSRGTAFLSVAFVSPDFLLSAVVLLYFILLLRYLREGMDRWWGAGLLHGIAYLAKAIALPWLAFCTLLAVVVSPGSAKRRLVRIGSAALIPLVAATLWSTALHAKYNVFTTGSQFKANLLQWTLRGATPPAASKYRVLRDVSGNTSAYMAFDPMPPGSWEWTYHPPIELVIPRVLSSEVRNIPPALKELLILLTPGIPLAFCMMCIVLFKSRPSGPEAVLGLTVFVGSVVLILAYAMFTIDSRYLYPIIPLWFSFAAGYLCRTLEPKSRMVRAACIILTLSGVGFSLTYWSSPFRTNTRDWQIVCRVAGESLRRHAATTVVSVGSGPFPEHGVGWEAGYLSCYFGGAKLIATADGIPANLDVLSADLSQTGSDAVLIWNRNRSERTLISRIPVLDDAERVEIIDPQFGEVGLVFYRRHSLRGAEAIRSR